MFENLMASFKSLFKVDTAATMALQPKVVVSKTDPKTGITKPIYITDPSTQDQYGQQISSAQNRREAVQRRRADR